MPAGVAVVESTGVELDSEAEETCSAAAYAAVMARIAVAEMPVERMRAERATWRRRLKNGLLVIVVLSFLAFFTFALFVPLVFFIVVIIFVVIIVATG